MSVIKVFRDLDGLFNYSTDENPTSQQDYQEAVKNWVKTIVSLVDSNLWQPETEYVVGDTVKTPSLSKGAVLYCLEAGTTGAAEPDYTDMGIGDIITDGTVTWSLIQQTATAGTYLPLSGGTLTGVVNGVTPPNGDNSTKLATTAFVNAKAKNYLPLSGGTMFGWLSANENEFRIRNSKAEHDGAVSVFGGEAATTGANLYLYGTSHSSQAGSFVLSATDGANTKSLRGQADGTLTWNSQPLLPVGIVQAFAGTTLPNGWLLCDGSAVSRTTYAKLFSVIGTTYGSGNGSTTFNLPNLVDKFVEGSATAGTVKSAGLPNITGTLLGSGSYSINNESYFTGAFAYTNAVKSKTFGSDEKNEKWNSAADFNASRSSSIYGNSTTVQPPALTMRYIIKY